MTRNPQTLLARAIETQMTSLFDSAVFAMTKTAKSSSDVICVSANCRGRDASSDTRSRESSVVSRWDPRPTGALQKASRGSSLPHSVCVPGPLLRLGWSRQRWCACVLPLSRLWSSLGILANMLGAASAQGGVMRNPPSECSQ